MYGELGKIWTARLMFQPPKKIIGERFMLQQRVINTEAHTVTDTQHYFEVISNEQPPTESTPFYHIFVKEIEPCENAFTSYPVEYLRDMKVIV
jgi:hypothetical protein